MAGAWRALVLARLLCMAAAQRYVALGHNDAQIPGYTEALTYEGARQACRTLGGFLASPKTAVQQEGVADALQTIAADWCVQHTAHTCPPSTGDYGFLQAGAIAWIGLHDERGEVYTNTSGWRWESEGGMLLDGAPHCWDLGGLDSDDPENRDHAYVRSGINASTSPPQPQCVSSNGALVVDWQHAHGDLCNMPYICHFAFKENAPGIVVQVPVPVLPGTPPPPSNYPTRKPPVAIQRCIVQIPDPLFLGECRVTVWMNGKGGCSTPRDTTVDVDEAPDFRTLLLQMDASKCQRKCRTGETCGLWLPKRTSAYVEQCLLTCQAQRVDGYYTESEPAFVHTI